MKQYQGLTLEEIQDLLIECYVAHKEAIDKRQDARPKQLEATIKELQRQKENMAKWSAVGSA